MFRLALIVSVAALCWGCDPNSAYAGETPAPAASVAARIDHDIKRASATRIGVVDIVRDVPLRKILFDAGLIRPGRNVWAFTAAGLRQSSDCGNSEDLAQRCFALTRQHRISVVRVVHHDATVENGPSDETVFTYRATPVTALGQRLAAAGVLVCSTAPRRLVEWRGSSTVAQGSFNVARMLAPDNDKGTLMDADCPHTRLSDGQNVAYGIDFL